MVIENKRKAEGEKVSAPNRGKKFARLSRRLGVKGDRVTLAGFKGQRPLGASTEATKLSVYDLKTDKDSSKSKSSAD